MKPIEFVSGVSWVGAEDWDRRLFDSLIPLPDGTSYNAYLVKGGMKTALLDTVDPTMTSRLELRLASVDKIDYLVAHHVEQDHSGSIPWVLDKYPGAVLLCSNPAKSLFIDHLGVPEARIRTVADGETVDLGGKTLRFIYTPWVHWPETMSTFLVEDRILFSCDWFGSHLASSNLLADGMESLIEPAKRYYAEIMMPFRRTVRQNMDKIKTLDIGWIAPSHGPVHRDPGPIMAAYRDWTDDMPRNAVVIPWVSMHGSTARLVERLIMALAARGVTVHPFDLTTADIGKLAMSLVDAATIIVGSPTVLAGPHPAVLYAVVLANALRPKARFASVVGSYGWAGKTVDVIKGAMPNLKVEFLEPVICRGLPRPADLEAVEKMAEAVARKHAELGLRPDRP
jgi:flavorubredoxin